MINFLDFIESYENAQFNKNGADLPLSLIAAVSLMWEIVACGGFNIETLVGLSVLTVGAPSTRKFKDPFV